MTKPDQQTAELPATRLSRRRPPRPKIHDVAELAGVSTKTVSRVLNNEKYVRPETREKVVKAVAELDYTPDFSARSLAGQRSFMLALFYGSVSEAYLAKFQAGVIAQCAVHRHHLLVERVMRNAMFGIQYCVGCEYYEEVKTQMFPNEKSRDTYYFTRTSKNLRPFGDLLFKTLKDFLKDENNYKQNKGENS